MKKTLLILTLLLSVFGYSQIITFPYSQTFSNSSPANFSSTSGGWSFIYNGIARTGSYSAKMVKSSPKFMYINLKVKNGYTYLLSFYTRNVCVLKVNTNESNDQITLLSSNNINLNGSNCKNGSWNLSSQSYTSTYDGFMYFQISVVNFGEDDVYLDDVTITETEPVALPITLLYFKGQMIDDYNKLYWASASEHNNDYYTIEKTQDGFHFYEIGRVSGFGYSNHIIYYEIYDDIIYDEISYYRLKQTDFDGQETIYDLISIDNRLKLAPILIKVTNVLGEEIKYGSDVNNGMLFFHYDDGTVIKRFF